MIVAHTCTTHEQRSVHPGIKPKGKKAIHEKPGLPLLGANRIKQELLAFGMGNLTTKAAIAWLTNSRKSSAAYDRVRQDTSSIC